MLVLGEDFSSPRVLWGCPGLKDVMEVAGERLVELWQLCSGGMDASSADGGCGGENRFESGAEKISAGQCSEHLF